MKAKIKIIALFFMLYLCATQRASAQVSVNFQVFYDDLSPYGTWVDNSQYGYVWVPNVAPGFTPYGTNGYWVFTDEGWTWVSNYAWGWAPFHYGRWYTDAIYGPMWVPDNEWGPGWVTWRRSEGYYGWAPIGPGVSISMAYSNGYHVRNNDWRFVRDRDFGRRDINNYYVNTTNNVTIINKSTVINNIHEDKTRKTSYNAGPDRKEVEKKVGKPIAPVAIKESSKPGQSLNNNQLDIYRPHVQKNNSNGTKPAPSKVAILKDVKPAAQRSDAAQPQKKNVPIKEQPVQHQPSDQPVKQQSAQQPHINQQVKQQPAHQQHNQPKKEQPVQHQQSEQPARQQPVQEQQNNQPIKDQPVQQNQGNDQPVKQHPQQQHRQHNAQPKGEQPQMERKGQPNEQQRQERQQPAQRQSKGEERQQH